MRTSSVVFAPGSQNTDPGVRSPRREDEVLRVLLQWLLVLVVSPAAVLDGVVVHVQVEVLAGVPSRAGHLIKAQAGLHHQGSTI